MDAFERVAREINLGFVVTHDRRHIGGRELLGSSGLKIARRRGEGVGDARSLGSRAHAASPRPRRSPLPRRKLLRKGRI